MAFRDEEMQSIAKYNALSLIVITAVIHMNDINLLNAMPTRTRWSRFSKSPISAVGHQERKNRTISPEKCRIVDMRLAGKQTSQSLGLLRNGNAFPGCGLHFLDVRVLDSQAPDIDIITDRGDNIMLRHISFRP